MREYRDATYRAVYLNSRDCLYYGYGFEYLNKRGLPNTEAKMIWNQAHEDMEKY